MRLYRSTLLSLGLVFAAILSGVQSASAAPYRGDILTLQQPDKSLVEVRVYGDEFYHRVESLDGYTLTQNPRTRWFEYARLNASGTDFVSTGVRYRGLAGSGTPARGAASSALVGLAKGQDLKREARIEKARANRQLLEWRKPAARGAPIGPAAGASTAAAAAPTTGSIRGLTLLVDFTDDEATVPQSKIDNYLNQVGYSEDGMNGSVRDYFRGVSGGALDYTNHVTAYYRARHPKTYYSDPEIGYTMRARELIVEALEALEAQGFDFSTLSVDDQNNIRAINMFYSGYTQNAWAQGLWPHMSGMFGSFSADGVNAGVYQITNIGAYPSLGTFCHENGHMLMGWPDLYDYDYNSIGAGNYCLMAYYGSQNNPVPPNAYFRANVGWDQVTDIPTGAQGSFLHTANSNTSFRYANPAKEGEFFFIESRVKTGRNEVLPDEGLLIWHVDQNGSNSWDQMTPEQHYHVSVEQADGRFDLERNLGWDGDGDLFHAGYKTEFGDLTVPDSRWWSGAASGLNIVDIGQVGPTMTFSIASGRYRGLDIGNPGLTGTAAENGATLTLEGGGADIWGTADQFYLQYVSLSGDGHVLARINSLENTDPWAKAGVMIRATSDANSAHAFMGVTAANGLAFQRRTVTGGESEHTGMAGAAPRWVRLTRKGNIVTAAYSEDGLAWTSAGSVTLPLGETALAGFAVTSHNNATLATAVFTDHEVDQSRWTGQDIGAVGLAGSFDMGGGTYTLQGSGSDIWGLEDSFFYLSQPFSGEGGIKARVNSLANTDPWAKAGVMVRGSNETNAGNAMMAITAANGAIFQRRPSRGTTSVDHTQGGVSAPRWVRLDNHGGLLRGYHSADGVNWTQVGSGEGARNVAVSMIGLAVTSHNNTVRTTAVFDNVEIQRGWPSLELGRATWTDNGNHDGLPNPGEEMTLTVRAQNLVGTADARSVTASLNLTDSYVTVIAGQADFGNIPRGSSSEFREFRFRVSPDAPNNHALTVPIELKDSWGGVWNPTYHLTITTPLSISGTVRWDNGDPVGNAHVTCYNKGGRGEENTDAQGRYTLNITYPGSYYCGAEFDGYFTPEVIIGVPPSQTGVDFVVRRRPEVAVNPSSVSDTLEAGQTRSHPVVISNSGDQPLEFNFLNPQSGYIWKDSDAPGGPAYAWNDISTTGARLNLNGGISSLVAVQTLSFAFPFYGTLQNTVYVTSYGYLTFVDDWPQYQEQIIPFSLAPKPMIAPFWGGIGALAGAVYFQEFPDRAVFQYDRVPVFQSTDTCTFQVVLYRDGTIRYYYKTMTAPSMGLVGMQNETGDKGFTLNKPSFATRGGTPLILRDSFAVEFRPKARDWIQFSPSSGTVAPGASVTVHIGLDAGSLTAGTYQGTVILNHNALGEVLFLPISLVVNGATTGGLRREVWTGIPGTTLPDLTGNPAYPLNPSSVSTVSAFEAPQDEGDNYGQRLRGYVTAPTTGDYTFFLAGDDNCELKLSTDEHPGRAVVIARVPDWTHPREWTKYPEQRSAAIRLEEGRKYYVEVLHKEGAGGDHVSVGWQGPGITGETERPIPASRLTPFDPTAWTGLDIGNPGRSGSQVLSGSVFSVTGGGADIWEAADQFRFVYQPLVGDGEITARVTAIQNTDGWAKGGVMIRESLSADSRHAYTAVTAANGLAFQRRMATGGQSFHTGVSGGVPRWVRLRREGEVFLSFVSMDGSTWTEVGRETIAMGAAAWVGLAVTSHNNAVTTTGTFESITVR